MNIETIHESNVNEQMRQVADQIEEYGVYDFFHAYDEYLEDECPEDLLSEYVGDRTPNAMYYYTRATKAYIRKLHR
jgi:hypothetical protein